MVDKYGGKDTPGNMAVNTDKSSGDETYVAIKVVAVSSSMCHALLDVPACYVGYR